MIDTHIHLDDERYDADFESMMARAKAAGIEQCIIPGADIADLPKAAAISAAHEDIFFAAGVHPYHAEDFNEATLRSYLEDPKCIAVGECGLDYFRLPEGDAEIRAEKERQAEVFRAHIDLALEYDLPLIVHIRDANQDAFDILHSYGERIRGVLHCYNASKLLLGLSQNFYYGIGGVLTFKNAKQLVEVLPLIPKERLVLETDGPYLTPHPHRGERNEPAYTALVAQKISELLEMPMDAVIETTTANARSLFSHLQAR